MNDTEYAEALEAIAADLAVEFNTEIRGANPCQLSSFVFVWSSNGAVEISRDGDSWFVECWCGNAETPASNITVATSAAAVRHARLWLSRD